MRSELGLILLGEEGAVLWANQVAEVLLGYSPGELQRMSLPKVGASGGKTDSGRFEQIGPVAAAFKSLQEGLQTEVEGEARFPSKDDKRVAVHWKLWAMPPSGKLKRVLMAISETAQASQDGPITSGYRDVFEYAVEGIFRSTIEGQFLEVNSALAKMYGYSSPAELMQGLSDLSTQLYVTPDRRADFVRLMLHEGSVSGFETEVYTADRKVIWIAIFARTVLGVNSEPLYFEGSVIDITERKQSEAELRESREQLRELTARIQQVREEERISVAREIHDDLGQSLTTLAIDLHWLSSRLEKSVDDEVRKPMEEKIGSMEQHIHWTLQSLRRILAALRPPLLDELGLVAASEFHLQEFAKRAALRCEWESNLVTDLPANSSTAVFRIFQEILTNIARHSKATRVKVHLGERDLHLLMKVEDNGCGIRKEKLERSKSYGLMGMVERAAAIGGELEFIGSPRSGTTVTLKVPLGRESGR